MKMKRRALLTAAAVLAVGAGAGKAGRSRAQGAAPSQTGEKRPMRPAPSFASDCHIHVYDSRFPVAANAMLLPPDAHIDDYRAVQRRIGTTRTVVVQPSTYGTDNRCMLNALASLGAEARGVAVVDAGVSDAELERLAAAGVRGIRFNFMQPGASITVDMLAPLSERIAALGWHVQLNIRGDHIVQLEPLLSRLASPIVFDHFARIPPEAGVEHPAYAAVQRLIDRDRGWVKLSGAYLELKVGPPSYADIGALARAFIKTAPQRLVWGSDWPHPSVHDAWPDEAVLFDALCAWAPDEVLRRQILVANPEALYGFPKARLSRRKQKREPIGLPLFSEKTCGGSGGGVDAGGLHVVADIGLELLEVALEALGELARRLVIGLLVGPGVARVEHVGRHIGAGLGHVEAEIRLLLTGPAQRAVERGAHQGAGMGDRHAAADAVGAARPAGVDQPALRAVLRGSARPASWRRPSDGAA